MSYNKIKLTSNLKHFNEIMEIQNHIKTILAETHFFDLSNEQITEIENLLKQRNSLLYDEEGRYLYK